MKPGTTLNDLIAVEEPDGSLKVWDGAKYGSVVDKFSKNFVDYVIVMFNHPNNPPSNQVRYLYLAPEKD